MRTEKEVRERLKRLENILDKTNGPQWYRMRGEIGMLRWMLEVHGYASLQDSTRGKTE